MKSSKRQHPSSREIPISKHQNLVRDRWFGCWCLVLLWSLVLGIWSFTLSASPIQLRDVTKQTGITFVHTDGSSGQRYIVETVASGLALFDYQMREMLLGKK